MTILIKNVEILGGARKFKGGADVFVNKDKISAIGIFPGKKAERIIDGTGMQLAPGFIDVNSTSDHSLSIFTNPSQENFLAQGVTTVICGQGGFSLAPFLKNIPKSLGYFTDANQINFNWRTTKEFLDTLDGRKLGINFGTLTGYENLIFGFSAKGELEAELKNKNNLNKKDAAAIKNLLDKSIREGSFGLSIEKGSPIIPSPATIIKEFLQVVKKDNALISFHFDECHDLKKLVREITGINKGRNAKIILSHFLPLTGFEKDYEEAMDILNQAKNSNIYFDFFPINENLLPIFNFLPDWLKKSHNIEPSKAIRDPWLQPKIIKEMPDFDPQELRIAQAFKFDFLAGKTFQELMEIFSLPPKKMMLKIMAITRLKATIAVKNINLDLALKAINHPKSLIASHAASPGNINGSGITGSLRARETFSRFLKYASENKLLSPDDAVRKITAVPAALFGLKKRGVIEENYFADLVILKNQEVKKVIVNGKIAWEENKRVELAGKILRHDF